MNWKRVHFHQIIDLFAVTNTGIVREHQVYLAGSRFMAYAGSPKRTLIHIINVSVTIEQSLIDENFGESLRLSGLSLVDWIIESSPSASRVHIH
jgi:hypothetical protein